MRLRRLSVLIALGILCVATPPTAAQGPATACSEDVPPPWSSSEGENDAVLYVHVLTGGGPGPVPGYGCIYDSDGEPFAAFPGPGTTPGYSYLGWGAPADNYTVVFRVPGLVVAGQATRSLDLQECESGVGHVWLNITYAPGTMAGFGGHQYCTPAQRPAAPSSQSSSSEPSRPAAAAASSDGPHGLESEPVTRLDGHARVPVSEDAVLASAAVASLGLAAVAWWQYGMAGRAALALLLGRRLSGAETDHAVRRQIASLVQAEPGIHANALRRRLGLSNGQVRHHLGVLVHLGELETTLVGGKRAYFPARDFGAQEKRAIAALRRPHAARLHQRMMATPEATMSEHAQALGVSVATVSKLVRCLEDAELVQRRGRTVRGRALSPRVQIAVRAP